MWVALILAIAVGSWLGWILAVWALGSCKDRK